MLWASALPGQLLQFGLGLAALTGIFRRLLEPLAGSIPFEGNTLTLRETALILQEGLTIAEKPIKDHLEAIGYRDAFEYIINLADAGTPLSERVIKEIHSLVLMNDRQNRGVYRSVLVTILGALCTPPQPYLVPVQMEQLLADYEGMKNRLHIVEAAAEFHLRFEGIHPFIDELPTRGKNPYRNPYRQEKSSRAGQPCPAFSMASWTI